MTAKKATKPKYVATIKVMGQTYEAKGASAMDAVSNLKPIGTPRGVSLLMIAKDDTSRSKVLNGAFTFRLFSTSLLMRELALKQLSTMFDL